MRKPAEIHYLVESITVNVLATRASAAPVRLPLKPGATAGNFPKNSCVVSRATSMIVSKRLSTQTAHSRQRTGLERSIAVRCATDPTTVVYMFVKNNATLKT